MAALPVVKALFVSMLAALVNPGAWQAVYRSL